MTHLQTTHRPDTLPNDLLFAAGADDLPGAIVTLRAEASVPIDGKVIWFPLDAVIRCEGPNGLFGGWVDKSGAVGLLEALDRVDAETKWIVEKEGQALPVPTAFVDALMDRSPRFSRAVMQWLAQACAAARETACFNMWAPAPLRIARLMDGLLAYHGDELMITQQKIAELTGTQRTTACVVLSAMKAEGRIHYRRGKISRPNFKTGSQSAGRRIECMRAR